MRRLINKVSQQKQEAYDALELSQRGLHDTEELLRDLHNFKIILEVEAEDKTYYIEVMKAKIKMLWEKNQ